MEVGSSLGLPLLSSQSSTWAWQVRRKGNDRAAIAFTFKLVDYWHAVSGVRVSRLLYYLLLLVGPQGRPDRSDRRQNASSCWYLVEIGTRCADNLKICNLGA